MKRFRLSTLMLLIVIAALSIALVVRKRRSARREAKLRTELADLQARRVQYRWVAIQPPKQKAMPAMHIDREHEVIQRLNKQISAQ